jgi:branched-chain amino acid transport system permease protein
LTDERFSDATHGSTGADPGERSTWDLGFSVFADYVFWSKSAEVVIMTILGGMGYFWGPPVGAFALVWLNQQVTACTEYWPFVLGSLLLVLLFVFPGGLVGELVAAFRLVRRRLVPTDI